MQNINERLTKESADNIVKSLAAILQKEVLIADPEGYILASTNESEIGNRHVIAKAIAHFNLPEFEVYSDQSFSSTDPSINIPIVRDKELLGIVSVLGNPAELKEIRLIIVEMVTTLFNKWHRKIETHQMRVHTFWEKVIFSTHNESALLLEEQARFLQIEDIENISSIAVLTTNNEVDFKHRSRAYSSIETRLKERSVREHIPYHETFGKNMVLFMTLNPASDRQQIIDLIESLMNCSHLKTRGLSCGISGTVYGTLKISERHADAKQSLNKALQNKTNLVFFNDLYLESLLKAIPGDLKHDFSLRLWHGLTEEKKQEILTFLSSFFENNGSIMQIADSVHLHKNTVQYRIKQIKNISGLDLRKYPDKVILYLSLQFERLRS